MVKRHKFLKNTNKSEKMLDDDKTFTLPKIVAKPKNEKEEKEKDLAINREKNETDLEATYLDTLQKLSPKDLGIICDTADSNYYPDNKKKDRHYNRGVDRALGELGLFHFLLDNLSPLYQSKITSSGQFNLLIEKYLRISSYSNPKMSKEEKDKVIFHANQMLINALTFLNQNMPQDFIESLREIGKPYFTLVKSISEYTGNKLHIPDNLIR